MRTESTMNNKQANYLTGDSTQYERWDNSSAGVKAEQHSNQWSYNVWKFSDLSGELTQRVLQIFLANQPEHHNFLLHEVRG